MSEDRARAERLLSGDEDRPGIRPAVNFADHSYPAFSAKQMVDFALAFASEREAIGRAAGREEADSEAIDHLFCLMGADPGPKMQAAWKSAREWVQTLDDARTALPVDGGKDGADE